MHTFLQSLNWEKFNDATESVTWRVQGVLVIKVTARRGIFLLVPHVPFFSKSLCDELIALGQSEKCAFIRVCPLILDTFEQRLNFQRLNFKPSPLHVHPEFSWMVDLKKSEDELLADMRKTTRYSIKKSEKDGIVPEISTKPEDIERFWKLYDQTVKRQKFVPFSKKYLAEEFHAFGDHAFWVLTADAGAMVITTADEAFYHHGASTHHPTASYAVQWAAIREAKRRGMSWYNFWGVWPDFAKASSGKPHPQLGLSNFKKGFGGHGEAYVHAQDLPLSWKYWINYCIEKIRKLQRGF